MKALVINLERRKDRLEYVNANYDSKFFNKEIFKAFDGKHLQNNSHEYIELKNKFITNIHNNKNNNNDYPYYFINPFTSGELGCFMSHLLIWKKIIDENIDKIFVFEDDCIFNENFDSILENVINNEIPDNFNILYLGGRICKNHRFEQDIQISTNISIKQYKEPFGTFSYLISKKGAELLYNYAMDEFKGNLGVDYFIDEFLKKNNHKIHVISPSITYSTINNNYDNIFKTDIH